MTNLMSTPVIWFIIGFVFFLLEFIVPGFILFFFGIGAWVVGVLTMIWDISINLQLIIFLGTSLLTAVIFRNRLKGKFEKGSSKEKDLEGEIIGKKAKAETSILPGQKGRVAFKGTSWSATSADNIQAGEEVLIVGFESIVLIVKSIKPL